MGADNAASDRPDRSPRSPDGSPRSPDGSPRSPDGSPRSPDGSPRSPDGSPRSPDGSPARDQPAAQVGADRARSHLSRSEYAARLRAVGWGRDTWENNPKLEHAERELAENSERSTGPGDAILKMTISGKIVIECADIKDDKIYLPDGEPFTITERLKTGEAVGEVPEEDKPAAARARDKFLDAASDWNDVAKANGTIFWESTEPTVKATPPLREHASYQRIAAPDVIGAGFVIAVTGVLIAAKIRDSGIVDHVMSNAQRTLASLRNLLKTRS
jgi:hypothetical protein